MSVLRRSCRLKRTLTENHEKSEVIKALTINNELTESELEITVSRKARKKGGDKLKISNFGSFSPVSSSIGNGSDANDQTSKVDFVDRNYKESIVECCAQNFLRNTHKGQIGFQPGKKLKNYSKSRHNTKLVELSKSEEDTLKERRNYFANIIDKHELIIE